MINIADQKVHEYAVGLESIDDIPYDPDQGTQGGVRE
jgi:hypothetical protein